VTATYKVLAQMIPVANTLTDFYVVPEDKQVVISTFVIANRSTATSAPYKVLIVPSDVTYGVQHTFAENLTVAGRESALITIGITLSAGDKVIIQSGSTDLSFSLFGAEYPQ
jgi:hypothetical protein